MGGGPSGDGAAAGAGGASSISSSSSTTSGGGGASATTTATGGAGGAGGGSTRWCDGQPASVVFCDDFEDGYSWNGNNLLAPYLEGVDPPASPGSTASLRVDRSGPWGQGGGSDYLAWQQPAFPGGSIQLEFAVYPVELPSDNTAVVFAKLGTELTGRMAEDNVCQWLFYVGQTGTGYLRLQRDSVTVQGNDITFERPRANDWTRYRLRLTRDGGGSVTDVELSSPDLPGGPWSRSVSGECKFDQPRIELGLVYASIASGLRAYLNYDNVTLTALP